MSGEPKNATSQNDGWNFNGSAMNEAELKPICQEVEKHFSFPPRRIHRFFAVDDDYFLAELMGSHFRGFHIPISGREVLPDYLRDCFFRPYDEYDLNTPFEDIVAFDNLIYIRKGTCADVLGCVITYAHELQHFMQHGHTPRLWVVNSALYHNLARFDATAKAIDIPQERDANIVSKRIAEKILGADKVREYAQEQIKIMESLNEPTQATRWVFFRDVPALDEYDVLASTLPFVEKYNGKIDFGIDTTQPNWWLGPLPKNLG